MGINNFTIVTDRRQIAVINKDKAPMFGEWRVVKDGDTLTFGCGSVELSVKDAKLFADIFCDYGEPVTIENYHLLNSQLDNDLQYLEDYYQVRKYLEENYTAAQKGTFDDVLDQIYTSGEQEIGNLECSEMKDLLANF